MKTILLVVGSVQKEICFVSSKDMWSEVEMAPRVGEKVEFDDLVKFFDLQPLAETEGERRLFHRAWEKALEIAGWTEEEWTIAVWFRLD